jgi:hypothetical protein
MFGVELLIVMLLSMWALSAIMAIAPVFAGYFAFHLGLVIVGVLISILTAGIMEFLSRRRMFFSCMGENLMDTFFAVMIVVSAAFLTWGLTGVFPPSSVFYVVIVYVDALFFSLLFFFGGADSGGVE